MSAAARNHAQSRHPALNRMPRDFLEGRAPVRPLHTPNGMRKGIGR